MAKSRIDWERIFESALREITNYSTPAQLRRGCEKQYGLNFDEAIEMAYENIQGTAKAALKGYRRKPMPLPPAPLAAGLEKK